MTSNSTKRAWLLTSHVIELGVTYEAPREIFDIKETCFQKYPATWKREEKDLYFLEDCSQFEEYRHIDYLTLTSLPSTEKSDVPE